MEIQSRRQWRRAIQQARSHSRGNDTAFITHRFDCASGSRRSISIRHARFSRDIPLRRRLRGQPAETTSAQKSDREQIGQAGTRGFTLRQASPRSDRAISNDRLLIIPRLKPAKCAPATVRAIRRRRVARNFTSVVRLARQTDRQVHVNSVGRKMAHKDMYSIFFSNSEALITLVLIYL